MGARVRSRLGMVRRVPIEGACRRGLFRDWTMERKNKWTILIPDKATSDAAALMSGQPTHAVTEMLLGISRVTATT